MNQHYLRIYQQAYQQAVFAQQYQLYLQASLV